MSFIEKVKRAQGVLEQLGRVTVRGLGREIGASGDELEEVVEELVEALRTARREESVLVWMTPPPGPEAPVRSEWVAAATPMPMRDLRAYTPKHLADRILQSKSALEGERKQVTVLFADVKGSMELAEQLGPEEWHSILERFFAILADGVHRFEGTVTQYTGDGIMALRLSAWRARACAAAP